MKKTFFTALITFCAFTPLSVYAFSPFVVQDIRLEGIQRTEAGTIFGYLPVRVGQTLTQDMADKAIRSLFSTGLFNDVRIEQEANVMVVSVVERPSIAEVSFEGMKEFDKDKLKASLLEVGLGEARIYDRALLTRAENELKNQYLNRGRYAVKIDTTVSPLDRNRVSIHFKITEGPIAKIAQLKIIGNKVFDQDTLIENFDLGTTGWLSWYTKNDRYSRQKLGADLEKLRSFYLDRGYLDFTVESTQVSITPDKSHIYITASVKEGERYHVSQVRLSGKLILPEKDIKKLVKFFPGDIFSNAKVTETTKAIMNKLGNQGYAFANVNAAPEVDKEKHEVAFTIFVDPGKKVYIRRINVIGNERTRDEVVRREMLQMESALYDGRKLKKSRNRVARLGYFEDVNLETPSVPGTTDQVDANFKVKEKQTGNLMIGAGYSDSDKLGLMGSISQDNIFGSGKSVGISINTSKSHRNLSLSFTDPYYTVDGVSIGYDIYNRTYKPNKTYDIAKYKTESWGGGVRFGYPVSEDDRIFTGLTYDHTQVTVYEDSPIYYKKFCRDFSGCKIDSEGRYTSGQVNVDSVIANLGWASDTRDDAFTTMSGRYVQIGGEVSTMDAKYTKLQYQYQYWIPFERNRSLMLNLNAGWMHGYGGKDVPFYKNFYVGGIGTVRGFDDSSLGERVNYSDEKYKKYIGKDSRYDGDDDDDDYLGGTKMLVLNAEYYFPMPGTKDKSMRFSVFVDSGYAWSEKQDVKLGDMRVSAGVGFAWQSPMGPLKFSYSKPIKKKSGDDTQPFQFQMGSTF